jgi:hypothetical protein
MRKLALAASLGFSLAAASPAFAGTVYTSNGFEAPTFTAGLPLVGQDGWVEPLSFLNPNAAIITTDQPFAGNQAVRVRGADLMASSTISTSTGGYYAAEGVYRRTVNFDVAGAVPSFPIVRVRAAVRVDGPKSPQGRNFFSASIAARGVSTTEPGGTSGIGELAISSDGNVYGYSGDDFVPGCPSPPNGCPASFLVTAPVTLGAYHKLAVNTDFVKRAFSFCVDGQLLEDENGRSTFPFPSGADMNILKRGSLLVYARPDTLQLSKASFVAHDDNFSITTLAPSQTLLSCNQNAQ